jgi:subfamily B ATP-binding cassette protein MsbA
MQTLTKKEFAGFLGRYILTPILSQRTVLATVSAALVLLALTQAMALLLIKGFMAAFFTDAARQVVTLSDLLPSNLSSVASILPNTSFPRGVMVWAVPLSIFVVGLLKAFASYSYNIGLSRMTLRVAQNYREKVFASAMKLPWLSSSSRSAGDWMTIIMADAAFIQTRLSDFALAFLKDTVLILSCLATLWFIHWPAALGLCLLAPIIAWQMGRAGKKIAWYAEAFQSALGVLASIVLGIRGRFRYMRAQHGEELEVRKFHDKNVSYLKMMTGSIFIRSLIAPGMELLGFLFFAFFIFGWSRRLPGFQVEPELVLQFFVALGLILKPARELGEQVARWSETIGGLKRSMSVIRAVESFESSDYSINEKSGEPCRFSVLSIRKIGIFYGERSAFSADKLEIGVGSTVAVVGPSGSGKSSLLRVISGLVPPKMWDCNVNWADLRSASSLVSQSPFLFKDTIRNNLLYGYTGREDGDDLDARLWACLSAVNMSTFLRELPGGLNTMFNPLDSNLSGGQVQRLVIARALLRDPQVLLLDEATSAVDVASEFEITQSVIDDAKRNHRVLIAVTHRLQWLSLYDQVWFVEDGRVVFTGSFEAIQKQERFRSFISTEGQL